MSNEVMETPQANADLRVVATDSRALVLDQGSMDSMMRVADLMASSKVTIPAHLRNSPGDCMAVVMQAMQWGMNPFSIAQKTHLSQGGALGYEAQLISAVIVASGALKGQPEYEFIGDWKKVLGKVEERKSDKGGKYYVATYTKADEDGLGVICRATLVGEDRPREVTVMMSQCYPRFSTQWATDPQQQITYAAVRKFGRRHAPGAILGVYTPEELDSGRAQPAERDITPPADSAKLPPTGPSPGLLKTARDAADKGLTAFDKAWKAMKPSERGLLRDELADLKSRCERADTIQAEPVKPQADTRTVEPNPAPVDDEFVKAMDEANGYVPE